MKLLTSLALILIGYSSFSQNLDTTWVKNAALSKGYGAVVSTMLSGDTLLIHRKDAYYMMNMQGEVIDTGHFNLAMGINEISFHGNHIYILGVKDKSPAVAKLTRNMDTVWVTKIYPSSYSRGVFGVCHDGDDIYVSGSDQSSKPFIAKLDQDGSVVWKNTFTQTTFANLSTIIKLKDGNFIASGNVDDYPLVFKFKANGDTLWKFYEQLFISIGNTNIYEKDNGNIVFIASNKFVELDKLGKRNLPMKKLSFYVGDVLIVQDTVYLVGSRYTSSSKRNDALVEVRNKDMDSLGYYVLKKNSLLNSSSWFSTMEPVGSKGFVCAGLHQNVAEKKDIKHNVFATLFNHNSTASINGVKSIAARVYPNPAHRKVSIITEHNLKSLKIYSVTGKLVGQVENTHTIPTTNLSNGIYFLKAYDGINYYNTKIIIKH